MSLPARHIAELSLRIVIRHTNRSHLDQVSSEARPARRNVALYLLQSRILLLWTGARKPLPSTLPRLFLHPTLAHLSVMLDPLPRLPWMLLLSDDMATQTIALVPSISPNRLSTLTLCYQLYQIMLHPNYIYQIMLHPNYMYQHQPGIVISLLSSASTGQQLLLWST